MAFTWVMLPDGTPLVNPKYGSGTLTLATSVDGGRNMDGFFIGNVVGNDKIKVDWTIASIEPQELANILSLFDRRVGGRFAREFLVYDPVLARHMPKLMYVGDRTMQPFKFNSNTGELERFLDVRLNIIEV